MGPISAPTLDVERARASFSSLQRHVAGVPAHFFDGAGGSQVPDSVIDAITTYLRHSNANEGGMFATSQETGEILDRAHRAGADFAGARPEEIAFGANMTTLNFLLSHAVGRTLADGDEIVVTDLDHEGNISPWRLLAEDRGVTVHTIPISPEDGTLDLDQLERVVSRQTRVVAFTLASNALGTVPDCDRIVGCAHSVGAFAWADGVHAAPHLPLAFSEHGFDVLLCSPYKFFGPHLGMAVIREDLAARWPADRVAPAAQQPAAHRYETGTLSHEALAGATAAIDYLAALTEHTGQRHERLLAAYAAIGAHERGLSDHFLRESASIRGLTVYGIADSARLHERTPTFLITLSGHEPEDVAGALGERGFFTWHGDFYAPMAIRGVGLPPAGGVRIGFLHYNTHQEIDDLLVALADLAAGG